MSVIISGFPGIGKTYAAKSYPDRCVDIDSSSSHYVMIEGCKIALPGWVEGYVDKIKETLDSCSYEYIFVSSHEEVREELERRCIDYFVVVPSIEDRDSYILRYLKRGSSMDFIRMLSKNYSEWIRSIQSSYQGYSRTGVVIQLKSGEYISDILFKEE